MQTGAAMVTESLVLGGDLGGTSTRILVAGTDGRERGWGTAGAGNPVQPCWGRPRHSATPCAWR